MSRPSHSRQYGVVRTIHGRIGQLLPGNGFGRPGIFSGRRKQTPARQLFLKHPAPRKDSDAKVNQARDRYTGHGCRRECFGKRRLFSKFLRPGPAAIEGPAVLFHQSRLRSLPAG